MVGASQSVGQGWFHNAGDMPPLNLGAQSGRCLSFYEREEIAPLKAQSARVRQISRAIGRDSSAIPRELGRNTPTRANSSGHQASPHARGKILRANGS